MTDRDAPVGANENDEGDGDGGSRTARVRTTHADADRVAAALAPDDTNSMTVRVTGDTVDCTIARPTTGGLRSTVDDYVVNLRVAERVSGRARTHRGGPGLDRDSGAEPGRPPTNGVAPDTNRHTNETETTDTDTTTDT